MFFPNRRKFRERRPAPLGSVATGVGSPIETLAAADGRFQVCNQPGPKAKRVIPGCFCPGRPSATIDTFRLQAGARESCTARAMTGKGKADKRSSGSPGKPDEVAVRVQSSTANIGPLG